MRKLITKTPSITYEDAKRLQLETVWATYFMPGAIHEFSLDWEIDVAYFEPDHSLIDYEDGEERTIKGFFKKYGIFYTFFANSSDAARFCPKG